jgi:hypothetical protein
MRRADELRVVKSVLDRVRTILALPDQKGLHFRDLKHEQRLPYVDAIADAPVRATTVFVHKRSIVNQASFKVRNRMYWYTTRYLLERVSWHCAAVRNGGQHGSGYAEVVFSNRAGMLYSELTSYLLRLEASARLDATISINWSVIKPNHIAAYSAMKRMGLQLADAVASSFFYAVEPTMKGYTEPRYANMLRPIVYCRNGNYTSYGLKFVPTNCQPTFAADARLDWVRAY